jgi:glycosyltransferase involved in cell wall biosynthesis
LEVSVITPVWDEYCRLLPDAIDSVVSQRGPATEVVVVDNASQTPLPPLPAGVRVVRTPARLTVGASRNFGLRHARAPFVLFLDADDRLLPGALAHLHGHIARRADVVAVAGAILGWNTETGETAPFRTLPLRRSHWLARFRRLFPLANLLSYLLPVSGAALLRREAVVAAGGFTSYDYGEDWGLAAALAFHGRVVLTRTPVRLYRLARGSLYFRVHPRVTSAQALRGLRRHVMADPRVPRYAKVLMPLIGLGHWAKIRRHTPGGVEDPARFYLGGREDVGPAPQEVRG